MKAHGRVYVLLGLALSLLLGGRGVPSVSAQDPGMPGPLAVTREEYNFGDTAFTPVGFPGPVEVRASVHFPTDLLGGPFPLVVFLHGRHATCHNGVSAFLEWPCSPGRVPIPSYQGYDYVAGILASHGYIVVSISANGISARDNQVFDLGAQARAELIQHHLGIWNTFNTVGGPPFGTRFVGEVDMQKIGTMGHSRGGEGVARHFLHNQSLGSPFGIKAVFPLAPVDFNRPVVNNVPVAVLLPYCDGDVADLQGVHYFDDARYSAPGDPAPKHTILVMGANHNFYNTIWTPGLFGPGAVDDWLAFVGGGSSDPHCGTVAGNQRLTAAEQRGTAIASLMAVFRVYLGGETAFFPILQGDQLPPPSAMTDQIHVSYHPADDPARRRDVNRLLDASQLTINTLGGAVSQTGITPYDLCGGELPQPQHCLSSLQPTSRQPHTTPSARSPKRGLSQLRGGWTAITALYLNELPPGTRDVSGFLALQFRASVNFEDPRNPVALAQNFRVILTDGAGVASSVRVPDVSRALFYPPGGGAVIPVPKVVLNTVRIPLSAFIGVNLTDIRSIKFRFDQQSSGALLLSDIAFADMQGGDLTRPDLLETAVSNPPAIVVLKGKFLVTDTVRNEGTATAGASTTRYYLSLDGVKSTGDKLLKGSRAVPALPPDTDSTGTVNVRVPARTKLGFYFLLACADDQGLVAESDETNNCRASATTVEVRAPDLVETAITDPPATATLGGSFSVTDTVSNQGNAAAGPSTNRYYLSLDGKKGAGDQLLTGSRAVPDLAPGANSTGTVVVTIPPTAVPGTYFLLGCADDLRKVAESNEKNNCRASVTQVAVSP